MYTSDDAPQVLREAAKVIRENGHAKGYLVDNGRVCLFGALNTVVTGHADEWPSGAWSAEGLYETCREHLVHAAVPHTTIGQCYWHELLVDWNNAKERTAEEVIAALEAAAKAADAD